MIHVVSLDRTSQRFEAFHTANPAADILRVPAIGGVLQDRETWIAEDLITAANRYTPAALGCAASHIGLWRHAVSTGATLTIAEDDVVLRADFTARSEAAIASLSAWDIILWSWNYDWPVKLTPAPGVPGLVLQADQINIDQDIAAFTSDTTPPALLRLSSAAGLCCYSITQAGARRLPAACLPIGAEPASYVPKPPITWANSGIDIEACRHYTSSAAYLALPPLAMAMNVQAMSTIRGQLAVIHDPSKANKALV